MTFRLKFFIFSAAFFWLAPAVWGQTSDVERRVIELEEKMRLIDPAFGKGTTAQDLLTRISQLEKQLSTVLAAKTPEPAQPVQSAVALAPASPPLQAAIVSAGPPLVPISITGDYRTSPDTESRLPVSGYMDFHVNKARGDSFRPDFHRFVLLFGHSFSERIKFWSELELEHSLVEGGEEKGEVALEQAYLDFFVKPYFNLRAGMVLTPIGIVNERHEPPSFNGVERPFVETKLIPTTWRELGFGFTGDLGHGLRYRTYLTSSLDASRFNAEAGISQGKASGFDASMRNPAKVGRLEFVGVRRLTVGTSFYTGNAGYQIPGLNPRVSIAEADVRYSFHRFDVRGLFANTWLTRAAELNRRIQQQTGINPNTASEMRGYYVEPAWHVFARRAKNDVIVFTRYEKYNTQQSMPTGYVALPQFNRSSWVTGLTFKPNADVAIKFDYNFNRNQSAVVRAIDGINLGIGWWF